MAKSMKQKKFMNMVYGLGASVVLVGALFKILHFQIGFLTGGVMLTVGLLTEAAIFFASAFEAPEEDLDWSLVYPELKGGQAKENETSGSNADVELSKKLDEMLAQSNLDAKLLDDLASGIKNFNGAAQNIENVVDAVSNTSKYNEQMASAALNLESLNSLYKVQADNAERQAQINESVIQNSARLQEQMDVLASNLSSLNNVYGGVLTAMNQ